MTQAHGPLLSIFAVVLGGCPCAGFDDTPEEVTKEFTATEEQVAPFKGPDGEVSPEGCEELCLEEFDGSFEEGSRELESCELVSHDPEFTEAYLFECTTIVTPVCIGGRRPVGLASTGAAEGADPVGRWLAETAHLEAASVPAFEQLAEQLHALGAPASLVAAAREAARDEIEHARVMTAQARAHGAEPAEVRLQPVVAPDAEALALDNAVEGCVRETWGALLAWYQAKHAEDPGLRQAFAGIARDETRHAELARSVGQWLAPQLSAEAHARVRAARDQAVAQLRCSITGVELPEASRERLGLPPQTIALELLDRLQPQLWAA